MPPDTHRPQPQAGAGLPPGLTQDTVEQLRSRLRGSLVRPGDADYEEACRLYNAMIHKHPALVARCADVADVIAAVDFAREQHLPLAVRGGGHNGGGLGLVDDGLVIDLSRLRGVRVDPSPERAEDITSWTKAYWDALHPSSESGAYVNFMMDEGQERVQATYRDNDARLVEVKTRYDPTNLFHVNQNIRPRAAADRPS
jgi:FAD/FMN-containing dehydrogenase